MAREGVPHFGSAPFWEIECPCLIKIDGFVQTGHTFEREAIERHLNIASSCPVSGVDVKDKTLRPNHALRNAIDDYRAKKVASHRQPETRRSSEVNEVAGELKRMRARLNQMEAAIQGQAGKDQKSNKSHGEGEPEAQTYQRANAQLLGVQSAQRVLRSVGRVGRILRRAC